VLVTLTDLDRDQITLRCERAISLDYPDYTLIIYPWFLYEKLELALEALLDSDEFYVANALMLFGQSQPQRQSGPLLAEHSELNATQRQAVQLCRDSQLAFVWGPPGTGKTTTLGHIVTELLHQGQRILVTSTTNAAVDQALAKLAGMTELQKSFERGQIVRIGQSSADTFGTGLRDVVERLNAQQQAQLKRWRNRGQDVHRQLKACDQILDQLRTEAQPLQLDLFEEVTTVLISERDLAPVFSRKRAQDLLNQPPDQQRLQVQRRRQRLETVRDLAQQKIDQLSQILRQQEASVVQQARVILATMTNVYLSSLLTPERFDAVIVEEAGMAILPVLFYCAALARHKAIMVGDPQQLPPIVQSRDGYVYRAMGRNIFEVAAQNAPIDEFVVMLDVQYRMHPVIGDLVSRLFYEGKLRHSDNTGERAEIATRPPYPGQPLVVIDTAGQTTCTTETGSYSRFNEKTASLCVDLAVEAVRAGLDSVAIITPYVAQSRLIRQRLARFRREASQVECRTIHRFQGSERDLVIIDTVDTEPFRPGVLLTDQTPISSAKNLLNVSLSRARGKLIILADVTYFRRRSPDSLINELLDQAGRTGIQVTWTKLNSPRARP
jgi:superfamily I DNA and/or RNA helicase